MPAPHSEPCAVTAKPLGRRLSPDRVARPAPTDKQQPASILVVDDEEESRRALERALADRFLYTSLKGELCELH